MKLYVKAPDARVNYAHDWGAAYLNGETIVASQWRVEPQQQGGLAVVDDLRDGKVTSAAVEGGAPGSTYDLINRIELSNGEVDERAISFRVEAR